MITMACLRAEAFGTLCRRCINEKYQIQLERKDCIYMHYSYQCMSCKEVSHIVTGITLSARWKLLAGKK